MIGPSISHYEIIRELGRGGMSVVYLARDTRLEREVAIKVLSGGTGPGPGKPAFLHEARAAAAIDHPFVCKVYEADQVDDDCFVVMEYVQGETLDDWARSGKAEPSQVLKVLEEILEALSKSHRVGIVHRDLKPSNIMLTEGGHAKVMDFGIAKRTRMEAIDVNLSLPGTLIGTPAYMAPEQVCGTATDSRSDLFSLGLIAYELLTGQHPFGRKTPMETAVAIVNDPCPPIRKVLPSCPDSLAQWVERLLQKQASHRFSSAQEALAVLRGGLPETAALPARPPAQPNCLAVLPFVNLSTDEENEYFSDGMTEEIIAQLSKLPGLKVISRTSVMAYKGTDKGLRAIGEELGAQVVLEGSVRRSNERVRISANLIDVGTDSSIWTEIFDRELRDVFIIQTEVSQTIAQKLQRDLTGRELQMIKRTEQKNLEGYQLYLKGRFFLNKLTHEGLRSAVQFFRRALECDPLDARSMAGMAICYCYLGHFSYSPLVEVFPKARSAATAALKLNPLIVDALDAMGLVSLFYDWDWRAAEDAFRRALAVSPNSSETRIHYSWLLAALARFSEAMEEGRQAVELDPLSIAATVNYAWLLFYGGRWDESVVEAERALELEPGNKVALSVLASAHLGNDVGKTIEIMKSAGLESRLGWLYAFSGQTEQARDILRRLQDAGVEESAPLEIGVLYYLLGEREDGLRCLEEAIRQRDSKLLFLSHLVLTKPLLKDADFRRAINRLGLGDVTMIDFPDPEAEG